MKLITKLTMQEQDDLKNVMQSVSGRAFIWRILDKESGLHKSVYTGNASTYYNMAKQDLGRDIQDDILIVCPELYQKMRNEGKQRQEREERENAKAG